MMLDKSLRCTLITQSLACITLIKTRYAGMSYNHSRTLNPYTNFLAVQIAIRRPLQVSEVHIRAENPDTHACFNITQGKRSKLSNSLTHKRIAYRLSDDHLQRRDGIRSHGAMELRHLPLIPQRSRRSGSVSLACAAWLSLTHPPRTVGTPTTCTGVHRSAYLKSARFLLYTECMVDVFLAFVT